MLRAVARSRSDSEWRTVSEDARHYCPKCVRIYASFKLDRRALRPSIFYERFISAGFTTRHHITRATSRLYSTVLPAVMSFYEGSMISLIHFLSRIACALHLVDGGPSWYRENFGTVWETLYLSEIAHVVQRLAKTIKSSLPRPHWFDTLQYFE